ncbi:matrixin family metalloprotease [Alteromonas sp. 5E99-2]|uniref:matrixin family metalloprotease n=1 Tax=Alteromonas sp. 5E99-2 TaxID=2817683 RepID=UPI001A98E94D|nr:matrixin family metalloprotease [Alteromonas sp. 5E99-2]MBO1255648.1 matrixin family metalloprotease [Alteromonas sp. 5E99-2]
MLVNKFKLSMLAVSLVASSLANAGGNLDTSNFTGQSTIPGFEDVEVVPIFWDARCANVNYTLDTVLPNAGTAAEISIDDTRDQLQAALDSWNEIPTSYINMNITETRTIGNGNRSFDFINELTFETPDNFTALASSPSTSLQADATFVVGDDIDGDGDSDVFDPEVEGINECTDIDNDGDIEFPAGFYAAGTIMDNDVQFSETVLWSTLADDDTSADIQAIAVHEFGHSHGLSHAGINVISAQDGTGSTMFPFIDTGDSVAEAATRTLHEDDIAWSSFTYPEGSESEGIAALQPGDQAFDKVYAVLTGSVTNSSGGPVLGASVLAISGNGNNEQVMVETNTGKALVLGDANGDLLLAPEALGAVDGDFEIPLRNDNYRILVQALDGAPFDGSRVSLTANVGFLYGQQTFPEEFLSESSQELAVETEPGRGRFVPALVNRPFNDLDFVVNDDVALSSFETVNFVGSGVAIGPSNVVYATRFSNSEVLALLEDGATLTTALVQTNVLDASVVPMFKRFALVTGTVSEDGTANINTGFAYRSKQNVAAQDADQTPFYLDGAEGLSNRLLNDLSRSPDTDLFLIVEVDDNAPTGASGLPPLVAVDTDGPFGNSFLSTDGGAFNPTLGLNFAIQLRFTEE